MRAFDALMAVMLVAGCASTGSDDVAPQGSSPEAAPGAAGDAGGPPPPAPGISRPDEAAAAPAGASSTSAPEVFRSQGRFDAAAYPVGGHLLRDPDAAIDVDVSDNTTFIVAQLRWTGSADLDLEVHSPATCWRRPADEEALCTPQHWVLRQGAGMYHDPGDVSSARLELTEEVLRRHPCDEPPCAWTALAVPITAIDPASGIAFELVVSVFQGPPPAEDDTAPDGSGATAPSRTSPTGP